MSKLFNDIYCLESKGVLAVASAPFCGSCPAVKHKAKELADELGFSYLDFDVTTPEGVQAAAMLKVESLPTLIFTTGGRARGKYVGSTAVKNMKSMLEELYNK